MSLRRSVRTRELDAIITGFNSLGLAIPAFWLGLMLILVFAVQLQWLPPSGVGNPGQPWYLSLQFLILPTATLALSNMSVFSRFVRSAMLEVLGADFVRTARSKGLRELTRPQHVTRCATRCCRS